MNHSKYKSTLLLVLSMSLPMIISMAVNALYNIVDSYFVAKLRDEAMTALSIIFPIQNIINSIAVGFGVGANAIIAFYLGAKNKDKANLATTSTIILSVVHGIILTLVGLLILKPFISSYTTNQLVIEDALTYGSIVLLFTIIIQVEVAFEKIFQSTGRMKVSMISMIIGFVVNIVLDPILIFGINSSIIHIPSLEMKGAALATGIGQLATLISYLLFFILRPTTVKFKPICLKPNLKTIPQLLKEIYLIGIPAALNMALPSFLISGLNQILKTFGDQYILILGIYYKLQTFIYLSAN